MANSIKTDPTTGRELYPTRDKDMACTLEARGHEIIEVHSRGRTMYYDFIDEDVAEDVRLYLLGHPLMVDAHAMTSAAHKWIRNLRHYCP